MALSLRQDIRVLESLSLGANPLAMVLQAVCCVLHTKEESAAHSANLGCRRMSFGVQGPAFQNADKTAPTTL